jgi:hypothetical protein
MSTSAAAWMAAARLAEVLMGFPLPCTAEAASVAPVRGGEVAVLVVGDAMAGLAAAPGKAESGEGVAAAGWGIEPGRQPAAAAGWDSHRGNRDSRVARGESGGTVG